MGEQTNLKTWALMALFMGGMGCAIAAGGTIYVDVNAPGPIHDGTRWGTAYKYLQDALVDANSAPKPVEVWVAQGSYRADQGGGQVLGDRNARFQLISGVAVMGGYGGVKAGDPNQRDITLYKTTLSGDIGMPGDDSDNSYHVVTGIETNATAILEGFVITGAQGGQRGGGMYNSYSSPTVAHCVFTGNTVNDYGGGMYNYNSSPEVNDCNFSDNGASYGGAVFNLDSNSAFLDCSFTNNSTSESGGVMYNTRGSPIMEGCTFQGNRAEYGGAVFNWDNSPSFNNCIFIENDATRWSGPFCGAGNGGAMYNSNSSPTVTGCIFIANYSCYDGGGMRNWDNSNPLLENCLFSENWSGEGSGGGMSNLESCSPTLINCAFIHNEAESQGGGVCSWEGCSSTFIYCTFVNNHANMSGGGIHSQYSCEPNIINCNFSGNSAVSTYLNSYGYGGGITNSYSSNLTMSNCIIHRNHSYIGGGGGICNRENSSAVITNCTFATNSSLSGTVGGIMSDNSSSLVLANSILWTNYSVKYDPTGVTRTYDYAESAQICCLLGNVTINNSCIQNWTGEYSGIGNTGQNPLFVREPNDGGDGWGDLSSTPEIDEGANDDYGDIHIATSSPCIDAGDNNSVLADIADLDGDANTTEPIPFELDSHCRIIDGDCNDTVVVDMGAYEFNYAYRGDFDYNCSVDFADFAILALGWLTKPREAGWNPVCDIGIPADNFIDMLDLGVFVDNWLNEFLGS